MTTTKRSSFVGAALFLFLLAWGESARPAEQGENLAGKYYAETYYGMKDSIDTIEFLPEGKCVIDLGDGSGGIAGSYRGISDGKLTIEYGKPSIVRTFKASLLKRSLTLTDSSDFEFYFVLQPEAPHPKAEELMGTYRGKREYGDFMEVYVYTRTPDHMAETLYRILSKTDHTYRDFHLSSSWTYHDGISVYKLEKTDLPEGHFLYSRDFVSKRDEKGIWIIDTSTGDYMCEVPVDPLALPPPPAGFHTGE
jgi:hypothetical protein